LFLKEENNLEITTFATAVIHEIPIGPRQPPPNPPDGRELFLAGGG